MSGSYILRFLKIALICPVLAFVIAGCSGEPVSEKDKFISEITIYNIPKTVSGKDVFRVYLNASNSQNINDLPEAMGIADVSAATLQENGTHSVTMQLKQPIPQNIPKGSRDPNQTTEPWTGKANYFSVVICPKNPEGVDSVTVGAGMTLNKKKENCNWTSLALLSGLVTSKQKRALYRDIIYEDTEAGAVLDATIDWDTLEDITE